MFRVFICVIYFIFSTYVFAVGMFTEHGSFMDMLNGHLKTMGYLLAIFLAGYVICIIHRFIASRPVSDEVIADAINRISNEEARQHAQNILSLRRKNGPITAGDLSEAVARGKLLMRLIAQKQKAQEGSNLEVVELPRVPIETDKD